MKLSAAASCRPSLCLVLIVLFASGCASMNHHATSLADVRRNFDGRFDYKLDVPQGWSEVSDPRSGKWEATLIRAGNGVDGYSVSGTFRVYALEPAFGYDPARHTDHWRFLSENVVPGAGVSIPLKPFTALKLPAGWEARVTALPADPGRAVWVARREGDMVFMYIFAFVPSLSDPVLRDRTDFSKAAAGNKAFARNKAALEYMLAHTQIAVHAASKPTVAAADRPVPGGAAARPGSSFDLSVGSVYAMADATPACRQELGRIEKYVFKPRAAKATLAAVRRSISESKLSERDKQIIHHLAELTFELPAETSGEIEEARLVLKVYAERNCLDRTGNGPLFPYPMKEYDRALLYCKLVGEVAMSAAWARLVDKEYYQFASEQRDSIEKDLNELKEKSGLKWSLSPFDYGAYYIYGETRQLPPAGPGLEKHRAFRHCFYGYTTKRDE